MVYNSKEYYIYKAGQHGKFGIVYLQEYYRLTLHFSKERVAKGYPNSKTLLTI